MNAIPAVNIGIASEREAASIDASKFKTQFSVSQQAPSPSVYWFHCDGMLGFDAFEKYFGDDQAEFSQALADRGFQINRGAMLEANHTTKIAVPALFCPNYYDTAMQAVLKDHETARTLAFKSLTNNGLIRAALKNETRLAFEQKGYRSQTFGSINPIYPPVSDRVYASQVQKMPLRWKRTAILNRSTCPSSRRRAGDAADGRFGRHVPECGDQTGRARAARLSSEARGASVSAVRGAAAGAFPGEKPRHGVPRGFVCDQRCDG